MKRFLFCLILFLAVFQKMAVSQGPGVDNPRFFPWLILHPFSIAPTSQLETGGLYWDDGTNCAGDDPCLMLYYDGGWNELVSGGGSGATQEEIEDYAGGMWTGNTETRVTVTYQDEDGTIDIVVDEESDPNALLTAGTDNVKDTHIDWGSGANQVDADDLSDGSTNAIPTLTQESNWDTAYGWGDHSGAGYESDTHASEHAVSGADTVFPVDPDADKYLMWDDDPGQLSWEDAGGGISIGDSVGSGTSGSVLFVDSSTQLAQDNAAFFWLAASDYLGLSTTGPDRRLDILDASNPQLRLTHTDGSVYTDLQSDALGHLRITFNGTRWMHAYEASGTNGMNIFIGEEAGNFTLSGSDSGTEGSYNVMIGQQAGDSITTGAFNVGIGRQALSAAVTGTGNVGIGSYSGLKITSGSNNFLLGAQTGFDLTTGEENVFIGYRAGYDTGTDPDGNVGIGATALQSVEGNRNIAIGEGAGLFISSGAQNIFLGALTGDNVTSGSNNLILGPYIDAQSATASNQMSLGNLLFSEGIDGTGTSVSTGNLGVGVTTPDTKLDVAGAITSRELSSDPDDPDEGSYVCWQSDGTGSGDDGDILCKITAGGITKTTTLIDFSALP